MGLTTPESESTINYVADGAGISFSYPGSLELEQGGIELGDTGQKFSGTFMSKDLQITFGGVTENYSAQRGGSVLDTHGYSKQYGQYQVGYVWGSYEVVPSEFIPVNDGTSEALVVRNNEIGHILDASSTAAFINTPGPLFQGVVFVLSPSHGDEYADEAEQVFGGIISSVRFTGRH